MSNLSLAAVVADLRSGIDIDRIELADRIERLDAEMRKEIEQRNRWLAECYRISGADPSGGMKGDVSEDWRLAQNAVEAVTDFRRDYDEACEEAHQLRAKLAACERLRHEWLARAASTTQRQYANRILDCANDLNNALASRASGEK